MRTGYSATVDLQILHGCQTIPCAEVGPGYAVCRSEPDLEPGDVVRVVCTISGRAHGRQERVRRVDGVRVEFSPESPEFFRRVAD